MRFIVTYYDGQNKKIYLCKTFEQAKNFIQNSRKFHPHYFNFKIKVIKF